MFIGSEGSLGVITEAWMRVFSDRASAPETSVRFADFQSGVDAVRALAQSGLMPANCRLLDPLEAMLNGAAGGDAAVLVLAFESADHTLDAWIGRAAELCRDHGRRAPEHRARSDDPRRDDGAAGAWRDAFSARAVSARRARGPRRVRRDLRDGDHLGSLSPRCTRA